MDNEASIGFLMPVGRWESLFVADERTGELDLRRGLSEELDETLTIYTARHDYAPSGFGAEWPSVVVVLSSLGAATPLVAAVNDWLDIAGRLGRAFRRAIRLVQREPRTADPDRSNPGPLLTLGGAAAVAVSAIAERGDFLSLQSSDGLSVSWRSLAFPSDWGGARVHFQEVLFVELRSGDHMWFVVIDLFGRVRWIFGPSDWASFE